MRSGSSAGRETPEGLPRGLYPQVLGAAWWRLPEPVRLAHAVGGEVHGRFRISHGKRWLARRLACWSGLPPEAEAARTTLKISVEGAGERWDRDFGGVAFSTSQWMTDDRQLVERFNGWELVFTLRVDGPALSYVPRRARLCLGRLRVPVPLFLAPRVEAKETGFENGTVDVTVSVRLPLLGLLIAYDGHLDLEGAGR